MNLTPEESKALDESIEHWIKDMVEMFKKGFVVAKNSNGASEWKYYVWGFFPKSADFVKCYSPDCALCSDAFEKGTSKINCQLCLYTKFYDFDCDDEEGHWSKFMDDPCLETAQAMVDALKAIRDSNENPNLSE